MHTPSHPHSAVHQCARGALATALTIATVMLLAALPTASASTGTPTPSLTLPATVSVLPSGEVETLLSGISLNDLDTAQLTEALSKLPSLSTLPASKLKEAVTKVIESLASKGGTLGELLEPSQIAPTLAGELEKLLSPITELPALLALLKGESLTTKLTTTLGSLSPNQLLDTLLGSTGEPEHLLGQLFGTFDPETLKTLLGSTLAGEPFSKTTVKVLASELGMTPTTLAKELGISPMSLPETATALTAPLTNGETLGVLEGLSGVALAVLGRSPGQGKEAGEEGSGSEKGGSGSGGSGAGGSGAGGSGGSGNGGSGGSGTPTPQTSPGTTTVLLSVVPAATIPSPMSPASVTARAAGKVKILSHRVKGKSVTLVIGVPAAGKLALGGSGVKSVSRQATKAERVTLRTTLTKARRASLRGRRHLRVKLKASFKIAGGASSSATVTVAFA